MAVKFHNVAEEVESLGLEDKVYLKELLEKMIVEERRREIKEHAKESLKEYEEGKIRFGRISEMKGELNGA